MASEVFDVVVVGGGVTGCGCALDAATRGLSVALVEQRDYAAGTSSRASKLIHGGVRYLEQRDFALVREALRERDLLLTRLSPHLVHPIPFLYPLTHPVWERFYRFYVGARILLYDTMGGTRAVPRHRHLSKRRALQLAPGLRPDRVVGGIRYYDGQVDDARFTMTVARTAAQYGAAAATSVRVVGFLQQGERVAGVRVRDLESGEEVEVRAREVINATGVWTEELLQQVAGGRRQFRVRVSKGIHLVVPGDRIHANTALILRTETNVLFVLPLGPALDHRHHRHRLGPRPGPSRSQPIRHRLPPRPRERDAQRSLDPPGHRGRLRRVAATDRWGVGGDQQAQPPAHRGPADARPGRGRWRQAHHLPGDGHRRGRRRRQRAGP